jgi:putative oxidoreductase
MHMVQEQSLRDARSIVAWRVVLATLIAIHGWYRFTSGGVPLFGAWLDSQGWPFGLALATAVTVIEIVGTPLLAFGRLQFALCLIYAAIYSVGLAIVHWPFGWFVVGAGRNGMEYSVLLIASFLTLAWQSRPMRVPAA